MDKNVFVVGSINTDLVISTDAFPKEGETVSGKEFFVAKGGKGANQAIATARLGGKCYMCGCVGSDSFGVEAIKAFNEDGVDTDSISVIEGVSTGTAVIVLNNQNNRIILSSGANAHLSKDQIDKFLEKAKPGDIYVTQMENPLDVIGYGLKRAKDLGLYVVLNPSPVNVDIIPYLSYCDLIIPNETEIEQLGGLEKVLNLVPLLVVTLGSKGFKIVTKDASKQHSCISVEAVDTTAAGDTCLGGIVAKLSLGYSIENAAKFGSLAASIACTRVGAQPSIPTIEEVENYINKHKLKISCNVSTEVKI